MIHFDYLAIAALSAILTAIPIVTGMLLLGAKHTTLAQQQPRPQREPEPEPEPWEPEFYDDGYHWEPTANDGDPYSFKRVRNSEGYGQR